jgi:hypothetical protein
MKLLAILAFCIAAPAFAQTFGEVTGRVTGPTGAAVSGVSATITNVNTDAIRQTVTTDSGDYSFPSLPPGFYRLRVEHAGFKTSTTEDFEVRATSCSIPLELRDFMVYASHHVL